ncbi:MAG: DUF547 domain-containing protein [Halothece sp. Uz-M2-17]|nr:DUF547 domain-containing protein [Halothece sp. Uz-M2-17]
MIDYSIWDQLLKEYVNSNGQVDYKRWQLEAEIDLKQWLNSISDVEIKQLTNEEYFTLLINLYNALVIAEILKQYPLPSILPSFLGIPNWFAFFQFFTRSVYTWHHQQLSLNDIEHKRLRQQWQDPRIHFALVCGAKGCPLLRNEAYQPTQINAQLTADANRFINNPDKVRFDPEQSLLQCSKIFQWYENDFLQVTASIPDYINQYRSIKLETPITIKYLPYNWDLND